MKEKIKSRISIIEQIRVGKIKIAYFAIETNQLQDAINILLDIRELDGERKSLLETLTMLESVE